MNGQSEQLNADLEMLKQLGENLPSLPLYILVDKVPTHVDFATFVEWMIVFDNRRVASTEISDECWVSTVFLPWPIFTQINYYFETRVFGGPFDDLSRHYQTWEEAEAGHHQIVKLIQTGAVD